jgi:hypothetical protein
MFLGLPDPDPHPDPYQNVTDPQHWTDLSPRTVSMRRLWATADEKKNREQL